MVMVWIGATTSFTIYGKKYRIYRETIEYNTLREDRVMLERIYHFRNDTFSNDTASYHLFVSPQTFKKGMRPVILDLTSRNNLIASLHIELEKDKEKPKPAEISLSDLIHQKPCVKTDPVDTDKKECNNGSV